MCFLSVGSSGDPSDITMVDSIKVFVKAKEAFGWPDEPQEELMGAFPLSQTAIAETLNIASESFLTMPFTNMDQSVEKQFDCCIVQYCFSIGVV